MMKKKSKSCPKYLQLDKNKSAEKPLVQPVSDKKQQKVYVLTVLKEGEY